jgi:ABC-type branched-subunit amino acid transport system substrate-binding protein
VTTGIQVTQSVDLAVNEINMAGGILASDGCTHRPIVIVTCDDSGVAIAEAGAPDAGTFNVTDGTNHLLNDLKVAAIIGAHTSSTTLTMLPLTEAAQTLVIAPAASTPAFTDFDGGNLPNGTRLDWRTMVNADIEGLGNAQIGEYLEKNVVNPTGSKKIKVAVVYRDDAFGVGMSTVVQSNLIFNGKPFTDPSNVGDPDAGVAPLELSVSYNPNIAIPESLIQQVLEFQPDMIYNFGLSEIITGFIFPYEDQNNGAVDAGLGPDSGMLGNPPVWVGAHTGERATLTAGIMPNRMTLQARSYGSSCIVYTPLLESFYNSRFLMAYPNEQILSNMPQAYDAAYLAAYAIQATSPPPTGSISSVAAAKAMAQTFTGTTQVDVGPAGLAQGLMLMQQKMAMSINGASGPLKFDGSTGEAPNNVAAWCIYTDPNSGMPVFQNNTGLIWNYQTGMLTGTLNCN